MSRKYDIRICKCGRIHAIPNERIKNALNADKNFLLICAACGNATLIGADISPDCETIRRLQKNHNEMRIYCRRKRGKCFEKVRFKNWNDFKN